jgi:hypothetical protein
VPASIARICLHVSLANPRDGWNLAQSSLGTSYQLADDLEYTRPAVRAAIDALAERGSLRLDDQGNVIGSAGLSIRPDRHEINLDGRRFWTWCA